MSWRRAIIADDGTHHLVEGRPLYAARFRAVQKFHEPGLAPVVDDSGAYHIDVTGASAYSARFRQVWGFYEGRAAVESDSGWLHILADGAPLTEHRYAWCGNFQGGRCAVRFSGGLYGHIKADGSLAYEHRHLYAGDFRDGIAVVRYADDGLCGHINESGHPVHVCRYLDLDVFHKGYASARDERGWFHIRLDGMPAYERRFAAVEPFYNGQALAESLQGDRLVVSQRGETVQNVAGRREHSCRRRILLIGNIGAGKSTVGRRLAADLAWPLVTIDDARRSCGDGSAAGEVAAWAYFLKLATMPTNTIVEFSGSGPVAPLLGQHFNRSSDDVLVLWLTVSVATCNQRMAARGLDVPYPDFGVPIKSVVSELHERLEREIGQCRTWAGFPVHPIDGEQSADAVATQALKTVRSWDGYPGGSR
ncbi:MAG: hypothetical protein KF866_04090 [Phycisphaeraceae bacterium]|nr:hypothetical protein [Phycisphaeraceae bacterium]MCW5753126.1 hypothetical protein [Phycisphaeraceae bacterium]